MAERVYVQGVGAISNLGDTWEQTAAALATGASGIGPITAFDTTGYPCRVAAAIDVPHGDGGRNEGHSNSEDLDDQRRLPLAVAAAEEAWAQAQVDVPPDRLGVFMGAESGRVGYATLWALADCARGTHGFDHGRFGRQAGGFVDRFTSARLSAASIASRLAARVGAEGPCETVSLACASAIGAIGEAARAIRSGACDVALCGGVGADVDPMMLAGFGLLDALSRAGVSRPFDERRDGFVLGEGAAMLVLSKHRGRARCAISGMGRSLDAWRLTAPDPSGGGACRAMRAALTEAGIDRVDYIQAHGTSTPLNDAVEAGALRDVFGDALGRARVSSVKGALGHWIAGAGALGALCAHQAIVHGQVFPTAGLESVDPDCDLPHVTRQAMHMDVQHALVNAFAFGGANCSLVMERVA